MGRTSAGTELRQYTEGGHGIGSSMVPGTNLSGAVICGRWRLMRELR